MGKIGNEARLISKLAQERMGKHQATVLADDSISTEFREGYKFAVRKYRDTIWEIHAELEK